MVGKKTGLYLSPIAEEIVNKVAKKCGHTKLSNIVNYIILEYDKLIKQLPTENTDDVAEVVEEPKTRDINEWFVAEEKQ